MDPAPPDALVIFCGSDLAKAINSLMLLTCRDGCTTITSGTLTTRVTGMSASPNLQQLFLRSRSFRALFTFPCKRV